MHANVEREQTSEISIDQIIASVRAVRDLQIEELMREHLFMVFLEHHYNTIALSNIKKVFLLKDLTELKNSSLNLTHYSSLITHMKELKTLEIQASHKLFLIELKEVFQKYVSAK